MDQKKKHRKVLRTAFTKEANELERLFLSPTTDFRQLSVSWEILQQKYESLLVVDEEVYQAFLTADVSEEELLEEMTICDAYKKKFADFKFKWNDRQDKEIGKGKDHSLVSGGSVRASNGVTGRRKFKLPVIELKKFDGNIRDWLPFWAQFQKVHDDPDIDPNDKIQYLLQTTVSGSRARRLVESFPAIGTNYNKIIEGMKTRFGRDDLQIEVYVRELLRVIINNVSSREKLDVSMLYDKIETQLRALETLGVTSDKYSAMLFPLIESCLPQELLRVWQRSAHSGDEEGMSSVEGRLKGLMRFLQNEVDNEQRIVLATESFGLVAREKDSIIKKQKFEKSTLPTAAALVSCEMEKCIFCGGQHTSEYCIKAQKLTLEQRKSALTEKKACFRCLKPGHQCRWCRSRLKCKLCGGAHATLMCRNLHSCKPASAEQKEKVENKASDQTLANHGNSYVFLQTLRVNIKGVQGYREVRALIDTGSQRSYILKSTVEELGYTPEKTEKVIHGLFGGRKIEQMHNCYSVKIKNNGLRWNLEALDQEIICSDISRVFNGPWADELRRLNIVINDKASGPVELLIGADVAGKLYTGNIKILKCGLVATETILGWTLMGRIPDDGDKHTLSMTVLSLLVSQVSVSELWSLDVLGITDPIERKTREDSALEAKRLFLETIRTETGGRYEVRLPWMVGHPPLPSNYHIAKKRLDTTIRKLQSEQLFESYDQVFKEWLEEEIIEEVLLAESDSNVHYLPHRAVVKESSLTTKIRPVFDASAQEKNKPSLNNCLEKGLNLIELIPSILLRFRESKIGVTSDIRKAFLQIGIHEMDRDFLRFFWVDSEGKVKIFRHRRVVFGVTSSPFLLGATIEYHLSKCLGKCEASASYTRRTVEKLSRSFYVDNCVTSVTCEEELTQFMKEASILMSEAKFDLRGWEFTGSTNEKIQILGMIWDPIHDTLSVNGNFLKDSIDICTVPITKRLILSVTQRVFDPVGFTCPITLWPKLLLQRIWEKQLNWDEPVDAEVEKDFRGWVKGLPCLFSIKVPRWIAVEPRGHQLSLHTFCDASQDAYAAVVYLRGVQNGNVFVHLLTAKTRVAPLKKMTIPRLELLAATNGARLYESVQKNFDFKMPCFFWSDSSTVISWISRAEEWAIFVGNRVNEIRRLTPVESWRHLPGHTNPADLPSRGCSAQQLLESRWWEGPEWLHRESGFWPQMGLELNEEEIVQERKKKLVTTLFNGSSDYWHLTYFSKYEKTVRLIAWILRFTFNLRHLPQKRNGELTIDEICQAENFVFKIVQQEAFSGLSDKSLISLQTNTDEFGLIRIKSQVFRREDLKDFCYPIVLPANHSVVSAIIFHVHEKSLHVGTQGLLSLLREKYWILGGRRTIRKVISRCVVCKRHDTKPFNVESPPLPRDRVRNAAVFEVAGVDFASPLYLKSGEKAWVCLFTCAVYRAVHLELATDLSTPCFMQVLRRFISRRGRPNTIYSNNGTNFVGAENALRGLDWKKISIITSVNRIVWRFNPPSAPWWGGFWERLIGVLKRILRKVLGRASLTYEELMTLLCDCEAVVNARPLTYVSNDPSDLVPLTPSMFLRDLVESGVPDCDAVDRAALFRKMRYKQKLRDDLRSRFRNEYLGQLKLFSEKKPKSEISLGEIVLVGGDNSKRLDWPLAKVIELLPGKDEKVRLVRVKTAKGCLLRPIQRIYPLECGRSFIEEAPVSAQEVIMDREPYASVSASDDALEKVCDRDSAGVYQKVEFHLQSRVPESNEKVTRSGRVSKLTNRFR